VISLRYWINENRHGKQSDNWKKKLDLRYEENITVPVINKNLLPLNDVESCGHIYGS
jgi:hypothetical protein